MDSAWFELKQLFDDAVSSDMDFETYLERNLGSVLDAAQSGARPEMPAPMGDRHFGAELDKTNPEGALLQACLAASSADFLDGVGNSEARWPYLTQAMYWLGHAKIAFMIDMLRETGVVGKLHERSLQGTDKRWEWSRERRDLILSLAKKKAGPRGLSRKASEIAASIEEDLNKEIGTRERISKRRVRAILEKAGYAVERRANEETD
jgi:hypothetical protein